MWLGERAARKASEAECADVRAELVAQQELNSRQSGELRAQQELNSRQNILLEKLTDALLDRHKRACHGLSQFSQAVRMASSEVIGQAAEALCGRLHIG